MDDLAQGLLAWPAAGLRTFSAARVLTRAGFARPIGPSALGRSLLAIVREGLSPAAAYGYAAARYPHELAIIDDRGALSFDEAARHIGELAGALAGTGVGANQRVGLLCRNHRMFLLATAALSGLGADIVYLNVSSSPSEISDIVEAQEIRYLIHDEDLAPLTAQLGERVLRLVPWREAPETTATALSDLSPAGRPRLRHGSLRGSRYILLTSGTTGRSKSASRGVPFSIDPLVAVLSRVPFRVRGVTLVASPMFHAWGFANVGLALALSSTVVVSAGFDAEKTLSLIADHRVRVLVAVPVMLQRLCELPEATRRRHDTSSLEAVVSSGSALPAGLGERFMESYGDILYNLYGSTEAAWASIATPEELRRAPGTAGRAPHGTKLRIVDEEGALVPDGTTGRVLVHNALISAAPGAHGDGAGEAGGGSPNRGYVETGDLGHFDSEGLLHIDGRDDDMIVSGGENVYPKRWRMSSCRIPPCSRRPSSK